jgi:hypothetical protein
VEITAMATNDPLQPISGTLRLLLSLVVVTFPLSFLIPQQAHGTGPVCGASQSYTGFPGKPGYVQKRPSDTVDIPNLAHGSYVTRSDLVKICTDHPGRLFRIIGVITDLPTLVLLVGGILLGRRALNTAAQPGGLYAPQTVTRVRTLGRFLILGSAIGWIVTTAGQMYITTSQIHEPSFIALDFASVPFTALLIGLVMLTLARVMGVGVAMREELEATL